jgi:hypothetical protein
MDFAVMPKLTSGHGSLYGHRLDIVCSIPMVSKSRHGSAQESAGRQKTHHNLPNHQCLQFFDESARCTYAAERGRLSSNDVL